MARKGEPIAFFRAAMLEDTNGCIEWPFVLDPAGYPRMREGLSMIGVHRKVCRAEHGEPFEGAEAAHSCHNRKCINRKHLSWKTKSGNQQDRVDNGTSNHGLRNGNSKLTTADVKYILEDRSLGCKRMARKMGVKPQTIQSIRAGKHRVLG